MWFLIAGIFFGIIGGMGMGGGIILIPILTLFLGMSQPEAQGANLIAFIPMAICALTLHFKNKRVTIKAGLSMCIGGAVGAILGALLVMVVSPQLLKRLFALFLIILSIYRSKQFLKICK